MSPGGAACPFCKCRPARRPNPWYAESVTQPQAEPFRLSNLHLEGWRQFEDLSFEFHPRLTVLTGANGSGKSTVLNLLAKHFNWQTTFSAVPRRDRKGARHYLSDWRAPQADPLDDEDVDELDWLSERVPSHVPPGQMRGIGSFGYSNGTVVGLGIPTIHQPTYDVLPVNASWPPLNGLYLSAFRTPTSYAALEHIPAQFSAASAILEAYLEEARGRYFHIWRGPSRSPFMSMKESLVAAALYGSGSEHVEANAEAAAIWTGFQHVLQAILPATLNFENLLVRSPDIIMRTSNGDEFALDSVSGGVAAIMEMAWQVFLRAWDTPHFTVLMDEPENHLHPSLQRSLLPSLLAAFPETQFVVATHSPFIVTAVPDSHVYVLRYTADGLVRSELLDTAEKSGTAESVLRDVLGVDSTRPLWAERRYEEIIERFLTQGATPDLRALVDELRRAGLSSELPRAVSAVTDAEIARQDPDN